MTTCYVPNYESIRTSNQIMMHQNSPLAATTPITPIPIPITVSVANNTSPTNPDYTKPLHVDCSIEYELPNQAKPPVGVRNEPLLMIHPCYFRKIESQKRSPFINNLPPSLNLNTNTTSNCSSRATTNNNTYLNVSNSITNNTNRQQQAVFAVTNNTASQATKRRLSQQQQPKPLQTQLQPQYSVQWEPQISTSVSTSILPNNNNINYSCCNSSNTLVTTTNSNNVNNNNNNHWVQQKSVNNPFNNDLYLYSSSAVSSTGKYRQYSRSSLYHHQSHRLHPYMTSSIPLASTFPQMQQVCYNV